MLHGRMQYGLERYRRGASRGGHPARGAGARRPADVQLQHHAVRRARGSWPSTATGRCWQPSPRDRAALPRGCCARHGIGLRHPRDAARAPGAAGSPARVGGRPAGLALATLDALARRERRGSPPEPAPRPRAAPAARRRAGASPLALVLGGGGHRRRRTGAGRARRCRRSTARRGCPGLAAPVTVRRDALGVPHLQAASILDACARRATSPRRTASGRWTSCAGARWASWRRPSARARCRADREIRTLGLGDAARRTLRPAAPDLRAELETLRRGRERLHRSARRRAAARVPPAALRAAAAGRPADTRRGGQAPGPRPRPGLGRRGVPRHRRRPRCPPDVQDVLFPTLFADDRILFGGDRARPAADGVRRRETRAAAATTGWSPAPTPPPASRSSPTTRTSASACPRSGPRSTSPRPDLDVAGVTLPGAPGRDPRPQPRRGLGLHQRPRRQRRPLRRGVRPARPRPLPRRRTAGSA